MKKLKKRKIYKRLFILGLSFYVICVLISQQKALNSYKNSQTYYSEQIAKEKLYQEQLVSMKENITSQEYIEHIAREKLDMYLPNERIYIDIGK